MSEQELNHLVASEASPSALDAPPPRWARRLAIGVVAAACLMGLALTGDILRVEWSAQRMRSVADDLVFTDPARARRELEGLLRLCGDRCPAAALEAASATYVELAAGQPAGPAQNRLLDRAETLTRRGLTIQPLSADGWTRLASIRFARSGGRLTPDVLQALRAGYDAAPFRDPSARSRILMLAQAWPEAPEDLRRRALDEFIWISDRDRGAGDRLLSQIPGDFLAEHFRIERAAADEAAARKAMETHAVR